MKLNVSRVRDDCSVHNQGVEYVHWVMHKCIMVKVGVKRKLQKVGPTYKTRKFYEIGGICKSRGTKNFPEIGENILI